MKLHFTFLLSLLLSVSAFAVNSPINLKSELAGNEKLQMLTDVQPNFGVEDFLTLTPKKYKELTGKKLGLKGIIALKMAKKAVKKKMTAVEGDSIDIPKGLYIVGAIFGWAWLMMGLLDDFQGNNWWTSLLLYMLCWIPGVIHAFIKMKEYY